MYVYFCNGHGDWIPYTRFLSNWLPPGPVHYRTGNPFCLAGRFTLTGLSRNVNITLTGSPPTYPPSLQACRVFPDHPLLTWIHNNVVINASGLSPYRCSRCPGFHRTAVLIRPRSTWIHNNIVTNASGLSPYRYSICPGFLRTAVLLRPLGVEAAGLPQRVPDSRSEPVVLLRSPATDGKTLPPDPAWTVEWLPPPPTDHLLSHLGR